MDIDEVLRRLPHRYPFLLVDKVVEIGADGKSLVALKNVTVNEPFFQGHFPGFPVMPGVLIAESLAQAGGVLLAERFGLGKRIGLLAGMDNFRFRRPVRPGDTLRLEVAVSRLRSKLAVFSCRALVDGQVVADGELMVMLADMPIAPQED